MKKTVFLTGATGTMGMAALARLAGDAGRFRVIVLARPGRKNRRLLAPFLSGGNVEVVWGDLTDAADVDRGVSRADIVLHVGGMVSPAADMYPDLTWRVNTGSMRHVVEAVRRRPDADDVAVVYIGSVSQYGPRHAPDHWISAGDPLVPAEGDMYARSKIAAERILSESGLRRWVSLRQTGILCPSLLFKGSDPISFHVPLRGALEWTTAEESGLLLANLCRLSDELPADFWCHFHNIGSGAPFRMSNYEFECRLMKALSCPPPEKVFGRDWFALTNFHGGWFADSDRLESFLHFRLYADPDAYFRSMARRLPFYFKLAGIVPPALIKAGMKRVALKRPLGTLSWTGGADPERTRQFFGSQRQRDSIGGWDTFDRSPLPSARMERDYGYDRTKPESGLCISDMRGVAALRGGRCLSPSMRPGDLSTPLEWETSAGDRFMATPATVALGGHWGLPLRKDSD